jgi:hypothetical protein
MTGTTVPAHLIGSVQLFAPIAGKRPGCRTDTPESWPAKGLRVDSARTETLALQFRVRFDVVIGQDAVPNLGRKSEIAAHLASSGQACFGSSCQGAVTASFATTFE